MYWEAMRTPALPGEYDVTDGSVDYYDTDWENVGMPLGPTTPILAPG